MRLLLLIFLITTLVACSDDKSSSPSKPSTPAGRDDKQDDKKEDQTIEVTGPVLEKPTAPAMVAKQNESITVNPAVQVADIPVVVQNPAIKDEPSLPRDPRTSSGNGAKVDGLARTIELDEVQVSITSVVYNLAQLQLLANNKPYKFYLERAQEIVSSYESDNVATSLEYCIRKYPVTAPNNASICYYHFGMGTEAEAAEFSRLADLYAREMFLNGDIKLTEMEVEYCHNRYKTTVPKTQTKCYFVMGYGTRDEYAIFIDTAYKLEVERVAAGQRKLDELARQYRESKKKND